MAKVRTQQQYKTGSVYHVEGVSERVRSLTFAGRAKIGAQQYLLFKMRRRPKKKSKKSKQRKKS